MALLSACGPAVHSNSSHSPKAIPSHTPKPTPSPTPTPTPTPTLTPTPTPVSYATAARIKVPTGFVAQVYATGLDEPTAAAYGPDGRLYVSEENGDIVTVTPDSHAPSLFATGFKIPLGLAWLGDTLYVSSEGQLDSLQLVNGTAADRKTVVSGLPYGRHQQDNVVAGTNGRLYFGSGSTCDACTESSRYSAAILSVEPNGTGLEVVASGTRNPYGLAVQPGTGRIYASVNGRDYLGTTSDPEPADMVIEVTPGANYGWPNCWPDARSLDLQGQCQGVTPPAAYLAPHSAPTGMAFYTGKSFPASYDDNLFVASYGAEIGPAPTGHNVVRIVLNSSGSAPNSAVTEFASGFENPMGVVVDQLGALLIPDWGTGDIYRIQAQGQP
jgi:glucose/arabinose dehydrogenase